MKEGSLTQDVAAMLVKKLTPVKSKFEEQFFVTYRE
jgi:hypothetical protein